MDLGKAKMSGRDIVNGKRAEHLCGPKRDIPFAWESIFA